MGLLKGVLKTGGIAGVAYLTNYILGNYIHVLGGSAIPNAIPEMINHAATAAMVYASAAKIPFLKYGDDGLEGILKKVTTTGATVGGVYFCAYDLASIGSLDIPGKIGYLWDLIPKGISKIGWPIDRLTNDVPLTNLLPDTHLEDMIYKSKICKAISFNGLSGSLSAKDVAVYTTGFFSVMGVWPTLKYLSARIKHFFSGGKK